MPGHAETSPADWWAQTVAAVRGPAARGTGGDVRRHRPFGPGTRTCRHRCRRQAAAAPILWADQRATAEMEAVLALPERWRRPLANPVVSGMAVLSLLWLGGTSALLPRFRRILAPKDWLRLVMTARPRNRAAPTRR
ncbi:hypothetical protein F2981_01650 [Sinorhizobium meliloti]|nr:hypothetical protein [Sinorhizobium meliloti]